MSDNSSSRTNASRTSTESPAPERDHNRSQNPPQDGLATAGSDWVTEQARLLSELYQLFGLELKLAAADASRIVAATLLMVPLLLLTWVGFCIALAWLAHLLSGSVLVAILIFTTVQLLATAALQRRVRLLSRSLELPKTRAHFKRISGQPMSRTA